MTDDMIFLLFDFMRFVSFTQKKHQLAHWFSRFFASMERLNVTGTVHYQQKTTLFADLLILHDSFCSVKLKSSRELTAQRSALPAGGWDETTPLCRNQPQAKETA